ncbi:MAG: sugar phosphate nucleotidyltransferase [Thaumarchaeota archaeon]|nr:sugar phosphate nucleotidyltransferase [Nitrososphaerota archaeon]
MKAVILAGGAGTRMRPLTYVVPKVLLPIAGKPLLEHTIRYLKAFGIKEFVVCVAYLKKQIIDEFQDGSELGVKIEYAEWDLPLGTGGQLKTAESHIDDTFLAMNGDIVTSLNVQNLINIHKARAGIGTIALKKFDVKIPYGFVSINETRITKFEEKPTLSYMANAGIYILEPDIFGHIAKEKVVSLETEIFPQLLSKGEELYSYFEDAYWSDVGSMADFERVNNEALSNGSLGVPQEQTSRD